MGHYLKSKPGSIEEAVSSVQSRPFIEDKEAYEKFFNSALKRFKVKSPADFKSDEEKKKFFDYIDKNYKSDAEKKTGKEDPKESKTLTGKKMSEIETNKIETKEENELDEMKKVEIKLNRGNVDRDIQKIVNHINLINKKSRPNQRIKITQNMSDDSVTLDGGKNVDIGREVADIKNFIGFKSAKVVEGKEENDLISLASKALSKVWGEAVEEKMKNEQRRVPDATIKKFADMTDKNQHTEVRLQIAKVVGDKNLIKKYEKLKKDQDKAGSLTGTLQRTRQALDKDLLKKAFDELGNARQVMGAL